MLNSSGLKSAVDPYSNILIFIKGSPDPDAIASAHAMSILLKHMGKLSSIVSTGKISLQQNEIFIRLLNIPVHFVKNVPDPDRYDAYIILDHQSAEIKGFSGKIPCAVHIDHHQTLKENIRPVFQLIDENAGSTSSLVALLAKDLVSGIDRAEIRSMCTALLYGIQTDTDKYEHASRIDYEALDFISGYSDEKIIQKISSQPLSEETLRLLGKAIQNSITYKDWLITGVEYVDESIRDSIAICADFLLKREKANTVIVFALVASKNRLRLDASFRTSRETTDLNAIVKRITPSGGARKYKGAYQINLDYFISAPDRNLFWELIRSTTVEILKEQRDTIYLTEIQSLYRRFRRRVEKILPRGD